MASLTMRTFGHLGLILGVTLLLAACVKKAEAPQSSSAEADAVMSPDGIRIAYESSGDGETALIFVHGWSCDRTYWEAQLQPFSRDYRVVAIDLAGHGESGLGRDAWTIESFGGDVAAVADKLGLKRIILIGHSMGGDVIAEAARLLPGRVEGLVWVDTYKKLGTYRTAEERQAVLAPFRANFAETTNTFVRSMFPPNANPSLVERIATDMSSAPPAVSLGSLESSISFDRKMPAVLQELDLRTIAINPEQPQTDVTSLQRYGVEVVLISGVGHFAQLEDPQRFNAVLENVVAKLDQ